MPTKQSNYVDLAGKWVLSQMNGAAQVGALLPGDNHSALLEAGAIPDPYHGLNERDVQWVADEDWKYSREFIVDQDLLKHKSVCLNIEGVDTFSEIHVNGGRVGATDNMFRRYRFDVKKHLRAGANNIDIIIRSPVKSAAREAGKTPWLTFSNPCHRVPFMNHIRKSPCHAGWDWGIGLNVSGVYGGIGLQGVDYGWIEQVYTEQVHKGAKCDVVVVVEYEAVEDCRLELNVSFAGMKRSPIVELKKGLNVIRNEFVVDQPELWWPVGLGRQFMYPLAVSTRDEVISKKIGLRRLELVTEPDEHGETMLFRVNGVKLFCKGANWIPADALPQRVTRARLRTLIEDAVAANMNMLRVWGGGCYENDEFYDICDELGVLVWQDLMFACIIYPTTKDFLENVKAEVAYQVRRLRHHACIALWCGDNEATGAAKWFGKTEQDRENLLLHYDRLNQLLWKTVAEAAGGTARFWPSSPSNGQVDSGAGGKDESKGDVHHYDVFDKGAPFDGKAYLFNACRSVRPRFCSEFGFQSMPCLKTLRACISEGQMNLTSPEMENHQRRYDANRRILEIIASYFRMPSGIENLIYLTQLQQALVLKNTVEFWRTLMPRCMGSLYWQLNDNWPVFSWSTIDYFGNWKQAHYHARRFFAPVMISAIQHNDKEVEIWSVNDSNDAADIAASVSVMDFDGRLTGRFEFSFELGPMSSKMVTLLKIADMAPNPASRFLYLELTHANGRAPGIFHNEHFFTEYKKCELPKTNVDLSVKEDGGNCVITVSADKPAFFVCLESDNYGVFSDNSFTLIPGRSKAVSFASRDGTSLRNLSLRHLRSTYD